MERKRGGESGSKKEMSHPRWTLAGNCVFNKGQSLISMVGRDEQDRTFGDTPWFALLSGGWRRG
jgi:hypothetical protein